MALHHAKPRSMPHTAETNTIALACVLIRPPALRPIPTCSITPAFCFLHNFVYSMLRHDFVSRKLAARMLLMDITGIFIRDGFVRTLYGVVFHFQGNDNFQRSLRCERTRTRAAARGWGGVPLAPPQPLRSRLGDPVPQPLTPGPRKTLRTMGPTKAIFMYHIWTFGLFELPHSILVR